MKAFLIKRCWFFISSEVYLPGHPFQRSTRGPIYWKDHFHYALGERRNLFTWSLYKSFRVKIFLSILVSRTKRREQHGDKPFQPLWKAKKRRGKLSRINSHLINKFQGARKTRFTLSASLLISRQTNQSLDERQRRASSAYEPRNVIKAFPSELFLPHLSFSRLYPVILLPTKIFQIPMQIKALQPSVRRRCLSLDDVRRRGATTSFALHSRYF